MSEAENIVYQNFSNVCLNYLQNLINDISVYIANDKKINKEEILNLWNETAPECTIGSKIKNKKTIDKICEYIGNKNGKCSLKVSVNSKTSRYCFKHLKQDENNKDENNNVNNQQAIKNENKKESLPFKVKYNRKEKLYIDEEYNFVFERSTKEITGKYVDNQIVQLNDEDIDIINFKGGKIKNII